MKVLPITAHRGGLLTFNCTPTPSSAAARTQMLPAVQHRQRRWPSGLLGVPVAVPSAVPCRFKGARPRSLREPGSLVTTSQGQIASSVSVTDTPIARATAFRQVQSCDSLPGTGGSLSLQHSLRNWVLALSQVQCRLAAWLMDNSCEVVCRRELES